MGKYGISKGGHYQGYRKADPGIFDAETNNDLYHNRIADHPEFREQSGLLEALKKMEVFPQEWLMENGNQLSNLSVAIRGGK